MLLLLLLNCTISLKVTVQREMSDTTWLPILIQALSKWYAIINDSTFSHKFLNTICMHTLSLIVVTTSS